MGAFVFMYHSSTFWYATHLTQLKHQTLPFLLLLNAGGVIGSGWFGWLSEKWGRRPSATLGVAIGMAAAYFYLFSPSSLGLLIGAAVFGFTSIGGWGMVPGYLAERFPTDARGVGTGFTYHVGVGIGALSPTVIGALQDRGTSLPGAMLSCILAGGAFIIVLLWLGPETRGREL
jgi:MFS family permease